MRKARRDTGTRLLAAAALIVVALLALGFAGALFPPGDSLAVARPQLAIVAGCLAAALAWRGRRWLAGATAIAAVLCAASIIAPFLRKYDPCYEPCLFLYQKNLLTRAWPRYELVDDILDSGADIVTLQEVSAHNRRFMARLFDSYPVQIHCPFKPEKDIAVLSSLAPGPRGGFCKPEAGLAALQLQRPDGGGTFWAVSVHLDWPFPYSQSRQLDQLLPVLAQLEGPVVLGGDFNMVAWAPPVARVARSIDGKRAGWPRNTYPKLGPLVPLPIDHVIVPRASPVTTTLRPRIGSDHFGLLALFGLP